MTLPPKRIHQLISAYLVDSIIDISINQLGSYLDLLVKWNAKTNLTAVRDPEEIVRTHFGESLFAGQQMAPTLAANGTSLLDYGSGAGFPGLPIQILFPALQVTLAESQSKKASFLREAVRTLGLATTVHAGRVEDMPISRQFDVVTLRAVDNMEAALFGALPRLTEDGILAVLTTESQMEQVVATAPLHWGKTISIPQSRQRILMLGTAR
ncbi:MAG: 16S rRNA (guanine(527)-N(7))-methyltransferase RsmG [Acidobacteriaceae bacterium]|nr:16S rRNA (guanine(527)-N(7))-methyltransferase RsmG [Acidobacteriaceae bacterium]